MGRIRAGNEVPPQVDGVGLCSQSVPMTSQLTKCSPQDANALRNPRETNIMECATEVPGGKQISIYSTVPQTLDQIVGPTIYSSRTQVPSEQPDNYGNTSMPLSSLTGNETAYIFEGPSGNRCIAAKAFEDYRSQMPQPAPQPAPAVEVKKK